MSVIRAVFYCLYTVILALTVGVVTYVLVTIVQAAIQSICSPVIP